MNPPFANPNYFAFHPHVQVVEGEKGTAIHDLFNGKLYWIPEAVQARPVACVFRGSSLQQAAADGEFSAEDLELRLQVLHNVGLGTFVEQRPAFHGYRPGILRYHTQDKGLQRPGGSLTVEVVGQCTYDCPFCASRNLWTLNACGCSVWRRNGQPLPDHAFRHALQQIHWAGYDKLVIRGGEPFLNPERLGLALDTALTMGIECEVHTTGYPIDRTIASGLAEHRVRLVLLVASHDRMTFDHTTQCPGGHAKLMDTFALLRHAGIAFAVKIPATPSQVDHATSTADWAMAQGAIDVDFVWWGSSEMTPLEFQRSLGPRSPADMAVFLDDFTKNSNCHVCFDQAVFLSLDGRLNPCIGSDVPIVDLHRDDISAALRNSLLEGDPLTARRNIPACANCEFRMACRGCLVRTNQLMGSMSVRHACCRFCPEAASFDDDDCSTRQVG